MNEESAPYTPDPAVETAWIIDGFLCALVELAPQSVTIDRDAVEKRARRLELEHAARTTDEASFYNLRYACSVLAVYEALTVHLTPAESVVLLRDAFVRSGEPVREKTTAALDRSTDAFRELVDVSKKREALQFGSSFQFERERDDDQAYLLNVRKCFWHQFFIAVDHPQLTPVLCEFDRNWFEAISPERHGVRFERKTTLGFGGSHCPFHFFRVIPSV
jgi:hypothetical protein